VRDAAGHTATLTKKAFITVLKVKPPKANFIGTPTSGKVPLTVKFTDMSKNNPDHWKWDFGDGKKSTLQNPSHTYTKAGKYTVTLSVRNYAGSDTKKVYHYIVVVARNRH
jgi:PKD repeat protein